jgi:hypothetical protein
MIDKMFIVLGNDRPQILVQLEDHVLQAIICILEGNSRDNVIDTLYSQLVSLEEDLANDDKAMNWFNFAPPITETSEFPSTPMGPSPNLAKDMFRGWWCILLKFGHQSKYFLHHRRPGIATRLKQ